jgi:hypothetical protein
MCKSYHPFTRDIRQLPHTFYGQVEESYRIKRVRDSRVKCACIIIEEAPLESVVGCIVCISKSVLSNGKSTNNEKDSRKNICSIQDAPSVA